MNEIKTQNAKKLLCGTAVGAANSLFGGGGGMLAVPLLCATGYAEKQAHATAILVILPVSLSRFCSIFSKVYTIFPCLFPRRLA